MILKLMQNSVANKPLAGDLLASIATLFIARIESRKPAAYLTQEAWLQGIPFYIDERRHRAAQLHRRAVGGRQF